MTEADPPITSLLQRARDGERGAEEELLELVYGQLHGVARSLMKGERPGHTLQPTALVNEAWLRLWGASTPSANDRGHFLRTAARAMRHVLVDHARAKGAAKRGQRSEAPTDYVEGIMGVFAAQSLDVLALHEALERLTELDEELARIVELRYFAGLSIDETAQTLGVSPSSVDRGWRTARAWLATEVDPPT